MTCRLGLQHVAGARQDQGDVLVGDDHHRFQPAQIAVGAPILGEFDAGAVKLPGILFELGLQPLEQREGVGGGAGETRRSHRPCPACGPSCAFALMTVWPSETWPSPATTTRPPYGQLELLCHARAIGLA